MKWVSSVNIGCQTVNLLVSSLFQPTSRYPAQQTFVSYIRLLPSTSPRDHHHSYLTVLII